MSAGVHDVNETVSAPTLNAYRQTFGGDCSARGVITLTYGDNKTCSITNTLDSTTTCLDICEAQRDVCLDAARETGTPQASLCIERFNRCQSGCRAP